MSWKSCRDEQCLTFERCMADPFPCSADDRAVSRPTIMLPTQEECSNKSFSSLTSLETFVDQHQPRDHRYAPRWRHDLAAALTKVTGESWVAETGDAS